MRLFLHLLWGIATVGCLFRWIGNRRRLWFTQNWSRQLLDILSVRLDAQVVDDQPGSLIVANHISWLDIYALNAVRPMVFVAKAEVRQWPLIGWLAEKSGTIFLRRGSRGHAKIVNSQIDGLLDAGKDVAIFPEGTTTDGTHLLNFHGALLQPAVETGRQVLPVAIAYYGADGCRSLVPAYAGETTLGESLKAILACRSLTVRLCSTPALDPQTNTRRELAHAARRAIALSLGLPLANNQPETPRDLPGEPLSGGGPTGNPNRVPVDSAQSSDQATTNAR